MPGTGRRAQAGRRLQPVAERVVGSCQLVELAALVAHLAAPLALQPLQDQLALGGLLQPVLQPGAVLQQGAFPPLQVPPLLLQGGQLPGREGQKN